MAPMLIIACTANHASMPVTSKRLKSSGALSIIRVSRPNKVAKTAIISDTPINPNFSAIIAKIESLAASGK